MDLRSRDIYEANRAEKLAYSIAHSAFAAVRALESQQTFGIDIFESQAQANQIVVPSQASDVDDAMAWLRGHAEDREIAFGPAGAGLTMTAEPDDQGEQQIGYDAAAWQAAFATAAYAGVAIVGEEDEYRGEGGAAARGKRVASLVEKTLPFAIVDPLDGSNQAAGMGQRSGWASCAMVSIPGNAGIAVAVLLGDGRGFVSYDGRIWLSESAHPDRPSVAYLLESNLRDPGFARAHFVIPAAKQSTIEQASRIMTAEETIRWISPLGGNPGILAGMLGAKALGAMQPTAYAWDHMAPLILAEAGFPVIRRDDTTPLSAYELRELLLRDLIAGERTETLYMGRTLDIAQRLRDADVAAKPA